MSRTADIVDAVGTTAPYFYPTPPLATRLQWSIQLWTFKFIAYIGTLIQRRLNRKRLKALAPTYTRTYLISGTRLESRIFIPKQLQDAEGLPIYLHIHGGGFAIGDAAEDDEFCHRFSNAKNICVISMDYRKAPRFPFPCAVQDLVAETNAVLDDQYIPGDRSQVAIGGFSAGGNLSLAITQIDQIRSRIGGVVCFYPVVDWVVDWEARLRRTSEKPDIPSKTGHLFYHGYVSEGLSVTNPLISPIYALRSNLPANIFFAGAEQDRLCAEAERMAEQLAAQEPGNFETAGKRGLPAWNHGGIAWRKIMGVQHGFTQGFSDERTEDFRRRDAADLMFSEAADWLEQRVFTRALS